MMIQIVVDDELEDGWWSQCWMIENVVFDDLDHGQSTNFTA